MEPEVAATAEVTARPVANGVPLLMLAVVCVQFTARACLISALIMT